MVLKLTKIVYFFAIPRCPQSTSRSARAISIYASESVHYVLSEKVIAYRILSHSSRYTGTET